MCHGLYLVNLFSLFPLDFMDILTSRRQIIIILSRYRPGFAGSLVQDYYYLAR